MLEYFQNVSNISQQNSHMLSINNYGPMALTNVLGKILEKCVKSKFFTKHNLYSPKQFGFKEGISTIDALLEVWDYMYELNYTNIL